MKKISQKKYDEAYYVNNYAFEYNRKITPNNFGDIPQRMGKMLILNKNDHVVDFGCGAGALVFFLFVKYHCYVTGIDYSKDAIRICQENKKLFFKSNKGNSKNVVFLNKGVEDLPMLKNIKVVYLQDVVEHMFDHEIYEMLRKFSRWNNKSISIVIHTDNNTYLKYIQPLVDGITLLLRKTTRAAIDKRKRYDAERHINLMTVGQLKKKLLQEGFVTQHVEYSTISYDKLGWQLGKAGKVKPLVTVIYFFAKLLVFLRPSFYLLAKYEK